VYTVYSLTRTEKRRTTLFEDLDQQNRTLIFDSNQKTNVQNEAEVIGNIITNLKKTATFIKSIGEGNFDVKWDGFRAADIKANEHTISGELIAMREGMKKQREEGLRQQWASDGLNKLSEIIRDHQSDFESLTGKSVFFIVKYLKAHQGGLFVLNDNDADDKHLELSSCYAFDKKKYVTKRIEIGQGLIGQVFLEGVGGEGHDVELHLFVAPAILRLHVRVGHGDPAGDRLLQLVAHQFAPQDFLEIGGLHRRALHAEQGAIPVFADELAVLLEAGQMDEYTMLNWMSIEPM